MNAVSSIVAGDQPRGMVIHDQFEQEEWRTIVEFPEYAVSNLGQVKRIVPDRFGKLSGVPLRHGIGSTGYPHVVLFKNKTRTNCAVHRLVCAAFHGEAPTPLHEVAHGDGVRANCESSNLRWATRAENHADKRLHGTINTGDRHFTRTHPDSIPRGVRSGQAKLDDEKVIAIRADKRAQREIAASYGVSQRSVSCVKNGLTWRHVI